MPAALSLEIRREIVSRREAGESFVAIAESLPVSYEGTRHIWQHWQKTGRLEPRYEACSHQGIRFPQAVYDQAIELKRRHPRWGAVVVRMNLEEHFAAEDIPQVRTLQSWFRQAGVNRHPATRQKKTTAAGTGSA